MTYFDQDISSNPDDAGKEAAFAGIILTNVTTVKTRARTIKSLRNRRNMYLQEYCAISPFPECFQINVTNASSPFL